MSSTLLQIAITALSLGGGLVFSYFLRKNPPDRLKNAKKLLYSFFPFYLASFLLQALVCTVISLLLHHESQIIQLSLVALGALIVSTPFKKPLSKSLAFLTVWVLSFLHVIGALRPGLEMLNKIMLQIGPNSLSVLGMIKALSLTVLLIWGALFFSKYLDKRLRAQKHLELTFRLILSKLLKTILISVSLYMGFSLLGIDLSALTFFAGAIGVGIAFGLQNILSNFFCGFILIMDRSIKPGDVICLNEGKMYGIVNKLHARYVSIRTREGKEHLIPNQEIISNKLENWSYSDSNIRLEIPFKVAMSSDLNLVEKLLSEIALDTRRVLKSPAPSVRFRSLVDNSVELLLRFWIADPENGRSDIRSNIILNACQAFQENGVRVPYPPRELHSSLEPLLEPSTIIE